MNFRTAKQRRQQAKELRESREGYRQIKRKRKRGKTEEPASVPEQAGRTGSEQLEEPGYKVQLRAIRHHLFGGR